jgi:hypothetical protein
MYRCSRFEALSPEKVAAGRQPGAMRQGEAQQPPPTSAVVAAAGDEVSAAIAALFSSHSQAFQSLSAQMTSFQQQFTASVTAAAKAQQSAFTTRANSYPTHTPRRPMPISSRRRTPWRSTAARLAAAGLAAADSLDAICGQHQHR